HVGPAAVAARDERCARGLDLAQRLDDVLAARDLCGIRLRPYQHEVVVHDRMTLHAMALGDELLFRRTRMHEYHVRITAACEVERLSRAERHDAHLDAGLLLEARQDVAEEPRLFGRSGGSDRDEALCRYALREPESAQQNGKTPDPLC